VTGATEVFEVGLLIPDSNTVTASDLSQGLAGIARVHVETMHLPEPVTPDGERAMLRTHAPAAAARLAARTPDLSVFGCSSALSLVGPEAAAQLIDGLAAQIGGVVIDVNPCLVEALSALGARRITMISPYGATLHEAVRKQLHNNGIEVTAGAGMGITSNTDVADVDPDDIAAFCLAHVDREDSDALLIACGNLRGHEARGSVTAATGLPVVTANGAVIDVVTRMLESLPPTDTRP
jgi:maleate isomerase